MLGLLLAWLDCVSEPTKSCQLRSDCKSHCKQGENLGLFKKFVFYKFFPPQCPCFLVSIVDPHDKSEREGTVTVTAYSQLVEPRMVWISAAFMLLA